MTIRKAYTDWSATYDEDRNLTRDLDETVTRETLSGLRVATVLELGCGTGKNTAFLATVGRQVRAVDFSEGMIQKAREKVRSGNVAFSLADITARWPCEDDWAELTVANLVLEHVEDLGFVFAEAFRTLAAGGRMFVCELHPYRQYQGTKANFQQGTGTVHIDASLHHLSDFVNVAHRSGLVLDRFAEWWHDEDQNKPPRLVSFLFHKPARPC